MAADRQALEWASHRWPPLFAIAIAVSSFEVVAAEPSSLAVSGVAIPRTALAVKAENYIRTVEPDFLVNHSIRTYVFGAMRLQARGAAFDPETAYLAALFHDIGLVPKMASPNGSFELDGAKKAEAFVLGNGGSKQQSRAVWNAIAMHDMGGAYQIHQSSEALLVGTGAASDVDGIDPAAISPARVNEVLKAFPRLQFKSRFTAAAIDHCRRKPTSQIGWLAPLCLEVAPGVDRGSVEEEIASATFSE